mmetsp:Transcript_49819/g.128528  ORF Transcript_49819/g.128528 Transcript_49819/m.128528 type:complete len:87 (+) Transcript_49819:501-761(+)
MAVGGGARSAMTDGGAEAGGGGTAAAAGSISAGAVKVRGSAGSAVTEAPATLRGSCSASGVVGIVADGGCSNWQQGSDISRCGASA